MKKKYYILLLAGIGVIISIWHWNTSTIYHKTANLVSGKAEQNLANVIQRDRYIVVLKNTHDRLQTTTNILKEYSITPLYVYRYAITGFTAELSKQERVAIASDPRVAFVSEDHEIMMHDYLSNNPLEILDTPTSVEPQSKQTIPMGIKRIGVSIPVSGGSVVTVAVLDTGIDLTHPDLAANIVANTTCIPETKDGNDDNGHGSHVAGTIAALDNTIGVVGVAPHAKLVAVKVLNSQGDGMISGIICGIDWVVAHTKEYSIKVVNMSIGGFGSSDDHCGSTNHDPLHIAICGMRDAGVTTVVAAANYSSDASKFVPAAYDDAVITVSALTDSDGLPGGIGPRAFTTGNDDTFAYFSNYGKAVAIAAPGTTIYSTWKDGKYQTLNGTSMAAAHVAGAAAHYLSLHLKADWKGVRKALRFHGESLSSGRHTDPTKRHPEPVLHISGN